MERNERASSPDRWVDEHGDYLFRYALGRVRNVHAAEELVQETFLAALTSKSSFAGRASLRTWLVGIMKHKIIDSFRRNARVSPMGDLGVELDINDRLFDGRGHWAAEPGEWGQSPQVAAENSEFWAILRKCVDALPRGLARAFMLREVQGLSSEEVCQALDITPNNLWVRLHRARAQLRTSLEERWFGKSAKERTVAGSLDMQASLCGPRQ